ncbi:somatostatin receptor type 5-like [Musca vetustissima]|uniref:somatostatin receptor type 5-like n=1 Tax=Musca vetustissima TaxID=27455 RepID=UPI002AB6BFE9|nr:somatostatin receptor type 5-like [Musca vetustissima]
MNLYLSILLMSLLPHLSLQQQQQQQHQQLKDEQQGLTNDNSPPALMLPQKRTGIDQHPTNNKKNDNKDANEITKWTADVNGKVTASVAAANDDSAADDDIQTSIHDEHLKPTLQLYEWAKNEWLRLQNASYNHSYANDSLDYADDDTCGSPQNTVIKLITMILYSLVCIVGLFGNTLVIYVVLRFSKMQTVTNIYILNLAIADECFLIGIPFLLYTMHNSSWQFGEYACKAYMVSTSITQFTSSIFLLIMSADRYIAVCHPISSPRYRTPTVSKIVSGIAWLTSALLMLPVILFANTVTNGKHTSCNIKWPEAQNTQSGTTFILYSLALGFATPLTFILGFYCLVIRKLHTVGPKHKSKEKKRSHRKVTKLVLTVITVYILCWLPYWISQVALITSTPGKCVSRLEITIFLLASCLVYSNSAMNPILYAFLSDNFKKSFMKACTCAARKDVNAQLQLENSMFPRFNKSKNAEKLLAPNKAKQRASFRQRAAMNSTTATTTTGHTNMTSLEANSSVVPCHQHQLANNNFLTPPNMMGQQMVASSCNSQNSNLLMPPPAPSSVCTENSNIDNLSECSEMAGGKPPVLHTDL